MIASFMELQWIKQNEPRHEKTCFFCICENKGADQLLSTCTADWRFFIASKLIQFLYFLTSKIMPLTIFCGSTARLFQTWSESTKTGFLMKWLNWCQLNACATICIIGGGNSQKLFVLLKHLSLIVRKPVFCIWENKDADQLRGNRLCFRFIDSTIPILPKSEISSL